MTTRMEKQKKFGQWNNIYNDKKMNKEHRGTPIFINLVLFYLIWKTF